MVYPGATRAWRGSSLGCSSMRSTTMVGKCLCLRQPDQESGGCPCGGLRGLCALLFLSDSAWWRLDSDNKAVPAERRAKAGALRKDFNFMDVFEAQATAADGAWCLIELCLRGATAARSVGIAYPLMGRAVLH